MTHHSGTIVKKDAPGVMEPTPEFPPNAEVELRLLVLLKFHQENQSPYAYDELVALAQLIRPGSKFSCPVLGCVACPGNRADFINHFNRAHLHILTNHCKVEGCSQSYKTHQELRRHCSTKHGIVLDTKPKPRKTEFMKPLKVQAGYIQKPLKPKKSEKRSVVEEKLPEELLAEEPLAQQPEEQPPEDPAPAIYKKPAHEPIQLVMTQEQAVGVQGGLDSLDFFKDNSDELFGYGGNFGHTDNFGDTNNFGYTDNFGCNYPDPNLAGTLDIFGMDFVSQ